MYTRNKPYKEHVKQKEVMDKNMIILDQIIFPSTTLKQKLSLSRKRRKTKTRRNKEIWDDISALIKSDTFIQYLI